MITKPRKIETVNIWKREFDGRWSICILYYHDEKLLIRDKQTFPTIEECNQHLTDFLKVAEEPKKHLFCEVVIEGDPLRFSPVADRIKAENKGRYENR